MELRKPYSAVERASTRSAVQQFPLETVIAPKKLILMVVAVTTKLSKRRFNDRGIAVMNFCLINPEDFRERISGTREMFEEKINSAAVIPLAAKRSEGHRVQVL